MEFRKYTTEDFLLNDSFIRYCLQSNNEDVDFWENWIQQNPDKGAEVKEARKLLFSLGLRLSPEEKQQEFQKLKQLIQESNAKRKQANENAQQIIINKHTQPNRIWRWVATVAAACLLILAGYAIKSIISINPTSNINKALANVVYATQSGERKVIELSDGSSVILNSNSTLKIPSDFNQQKRKLQLTGEAFFDVAKNKEKPFMVASKNVYVEALGTSFKIRSYDFEPAIKIMLVEGKVKVEDKANQLNTAVLLPGEQMNIYAATGKMLKQEFDLTNELNWKENKLIFKDASLEQIASQLEYWYGLKVNLNILSHQKVRFNGEFLNKDIDKVLSAITYVNKLNYSINNKEIYISSLK